MAPDKSALDGEVLRNLRDLGGPEDPEFLPGLLRQYAEHAERSIQSLRAAAASGDSKALEREAHGLKGSSANVGAKPAAAICAELQTLGAAGKASSAGPRVEALATEFSRVKARIAAELAPR